MVLHAKHLAGTQEHSDELSRLRELDSEKNTSTPTD